MFEKEYHHLGCICLPLAKINDQNTDFRLNRNSLATLTSHLAHLQSTNFILFSLCQPLTISNSELKKDGQLMQKNHNIQLELLAYLLFLLFMVVKQKVLQAVYKSFPYVFYIQNNKPFYFYDFLILCRDMFPYNHLNIKI